VSIYKNINKGGKNKTVQQESWTESLFICSRLFAIIGSLTPVKSVNGR